MVKLPKNCKVTYTNDSVHVRMTYSTKLPQGVYDGKDLGEGHPNVTVWESYPYTDKNGRQIKGKKYFALEFEIAYQKNFPILISETYFNYKKKAMLFNRKKKQQLLQKEIDILSKSKCVGTWDLWHLKQSNQLPWPPDEI